MATKKKTAKATKPEAKKATTRKVDAKTPAADPAKKLSQIAAAIEVLKRAKEPISCHELVEAMTQRGLWRSPGGKTPEATLYASILSGLRKGQDARFRKAAPGRVTLAAKS